MESSRDGLISPENPSTLQNLPTCFKSAIGIEQTTMPSLIPVTAVARLRSRVCSACAGRTSFAGSIPCRRAIRHDKRRKTKRRNSDNKYVLFAQRESTRGARPWPSERMTGLGYFRKITKRLGRFPSGSIPRDDGKQTLPDGDTACDQLPVHSV